MRGDKNLNPRACQTRAVRRATVGMSLGLILASGSSPKENTLFRKRAVPNQMGYRRKLSGTLR